MPKIPRRGIFGMTLSLPCANEIRCTLEMSRIPHHDGVVCEGRIAVPVHQKVREAARTISSERYRRVERPAVFSFGVNESGIDRENVAGSAEALTLAHQIF